MLMLTLTPAVVGSTDRDATVGICGLIRIRDVADIESATRSRKGTRLVSAIGRSSSRLDFALSGFEPGQVLFEIQVDADAPCNAPRLTCRVSCLVRGCPPAVLAEGRDEGRATA
jgi:hypothetical protein